MGCNTIVNGLLWYFDHTSNNLHNNSNATTTIMIITLITTAERKRDRDRVRENVVGQDEEAI